METYRAKGRNVPVRHRELALANSVLMAAPWSYWKEGVGDEWGIPGKVRLIKNRKGSAWARRRDVGRDREALLGSARCSTVVRVRWTYRIPGTCPCLRAGRSRRSGTSLRPCAYRDGASMVARPTSRTRWQTGRPRKHPTSVAARIATMPMMRTLAML